MEIKIVLQHIESIKTYKETMVFSYFDCKYVYKEKRGWEWLKFPRKAGFYILNPLGVDEYVGTSFDDLKISSVFCFNEKHKAIQYLPACTIIMGSKEKFVKYFKSYKQALEYSDMIKELIVESKSSKIQTYTL